MAQLKQILKRIFFLPPLPTVLIAAPSFALVILILVTENQGVIAYLSYMMSAYALAITCTSVPRVKRFMKSVRADIEKHPLMEKLSHTSLGARFLGDVRFRTEISLYLGFLINLLYIVMKMASGIYYRSVWFISIAVYYILLAFMRFLLFRRGKEGTTGNDLEAELRRYRVCGVLLLFMNQALAGMVVFMVYQNKSYDYPGMLIYAMAAYSFYCVSIASVNVIKFRRHGSPVLSAAKVISLVSAMVSILSLETAMVTRFGDQDDFSFRRVMTGATGGGVCTLVLGIAVFMIVKSSLQLKKVNMTETNKDQFENI
ncbi:MAG: hypothetical protein HDR21_04715 [Lachnospiraceae bacterium]|nr:hypothetical protein [Lachnospiraceae bacterium]